MLKVKAAALFRDGTRLHALNQQHQALSVHRAAPGGWLLKNGPRPVCRNQPEHTAFPKTLEFRVNGFGLDRVNLPRAAALIPM